MNDTAVPTPADTGRSRMIGVLLVMAGVSLFSVMDGIAKDLTQRNHPLAIAWVRYAANVLLVMAVLRRSPVDLLRTTRPGLQALRGLALFLSTLCFFTAISFIPLADAVAIGQVAPLLVTAFSVVLLGEQVGPRRWVAVGIGFCGALIIVRPGFAEFHWAMILPLMVAATYALYAIMTRVLGPTEKPEGMLFWGAVVGTVGGTVIAPFVWTTPSAVDFALMVLIGAIGGVSHFLVILGYRRAPASTAAPFTYVQLLSATAVGYLMFDHLPDGMTLIGAALIIASGIYVALREAQLARAAAKGASRG
ncbi:MAG: DMT family transporter [Alphaproteobacteria bacterium]|nr:DMT family transporter [Alphaproteobacteria bacterium]